jgi:alkanesulfonate monooxygenase SsuD/methylene tetrahydromethanopterin reductase-like flavin-dependent oxidoreductase (luciferase family)
VTREDMTNGHEYIAEGRRRLDALAREAGRDPAEIKISVIVRGPQVDGELGPRSSVTRDALKRLEDAGAERALVSLSTITSEADAVEALSRIAQAAL